jgi:hypothetical protein
MTFANTTLLTNSSNTYLPEICDTKINFFTVALEVLNDRYHLLRSSTDRFLVHIIV